MPRATDRAVAGGGRGGGGGNGGGGGDAFVQLYLLQQSSEKYPSSRWSVPDGQFPPYPVCQQLWHTPSTATAPVFDHPDAPHAAPLHAGCGTVPGGAAQTSHPTPMLIPDDQVKAPSSNTSLGPVVPLYATPFTISSPALSVSKLVALSSWPTAKLVGVIVHDWL